MKNRLPRISFEITPRCNLDCRYCYNHWKCNSEKIPGEDSYKHASKTLKRIFKIAKVDNIVFTGGEPLLAERFLELVLYARMKKASVSVISNGTYPDFSYYKQMVDLGVSLFELPVHSHNAGTHDYLTRNTGSWEKSVSIIKELLSLNADVVAVIVLTKANCKDVGDTLRFIDSLGIKRVLMNRVNIGGNVINNIKELIMSRDELSDAFRSIMVTSKELKMTISSGVCTPICILNPNDYRGINFSFCSRDLSRSPVTMDHKGNVRFCNHSPVIIGNIFQDSLDSIINSPELNKWNEIIPDFCKDCKAYVTCKAGCRAASEQMGLSLYHPDPIINYIEPDPELLKKLKS